MSIPVEREPEPEPPYERCCFCRKGSSYWHTPKDVPVCLDCAEFMSPADVPSKAEWIARESAALRDTARRHGLPSVFC